MQIGVSWPWTGTGIASSPAFVREPESPVSCADITPWDRAEPDGCAERFIRTLKENLLWLQRFETVEELWLALQRFRETYNRSWIIERHGYKTPAQVRAAQLDQLPMAASTQIGVSEPWTGTG